MKKILLISTFAVVTNLFITGCVLNKEEEHSSAPAHGSSRTTATESHTIRAY